MKYVNRRIRRNLQLGIFFVPGLEDAFLLGRVTNERDCAIINLISNFYTHVRITHHIVIPAVRGTRGEDRDQVELAVVVEAINVYRMRQQVPRLGLDLDYRDIVREVGGFFSECRERLQSLGVRPEQIIFDPGIGFGKTLEHNLQLLASLKSFARWERPLLLGVSRKSFIEKISGAKLNERLPASLACATLAIESGAHIIRAHDVKATVQTARMAEAILARKPNAD